MLQGVDGIQMEELIDVNGERWLLGATLKDTRESPTTGPWVCDGSTQMLTSNVTALLRSMVK